MSGVDWRLNPDDLAYNLYKLYQTFPSFDSIFPHFRNSINKGWPGRQVRNRFPYYLSKRLQRNLYWRRKRRYKRRYYS